MTELGSQPGHRGVRLMRPPWVRLASAFGSSSRLRTTSSRSRASVRPSTRIGRRATTALERATGFFSRSLTLPEGIDPDDVSAKFENGVLTVRIPKPAQTEPKRVKLGVGGGGSQTSDADSATSGNGASQADGDTSPAGEDESR